MIRGFSESLIALSFDEPKPTPEFHMELWDMCCSDHRFVAVAAPRGHAKSTAVTLVYVLAAVLFRVHDYVLIVSDTLEQSRGFLEDIKKQLEMNEELKAAFGIKGYTIDTQTDIVVEFNDGASFKIDAKGSEQKVRGLKWNNKRPNLIVCDDLENDEIVMNSDRREKFRKWFMAALMPALSPGGKIRMVGTILHADSWLMRCVPQEGLKDTVVTPLKTYSVQKNPSWHGVVYRAHIGSVPSDIGGAKDILWGSRLNKEWFQKEYITRHQSGHPELYSQEFLNRPIDENTAYFRKHDFVPISDLDRQDFEKGRKPLTYYAGVDLAISQKERADFSVFHVVGVDSNNVMYHTDLIKGRFDGPEIVDTLFQLQRRYKLNFVAIEDEKIAKSLGGFFREEMLRRGEFINFIPIKPTQDKPTRARPLQGRMRMGTVKFNKEADYYHSLETEFLQFPRGVHDDQVDALGILCLALEKIEVAPTATELAEEELSEQEYSSQVMGINNGRSRRTGY